MVKKDVASLEWTTFNFKKGNKGPPKSIKQEKKVLMCLAKVTYKPGSLYPLLYIFIKRSDYNLRITDDIFWLSSPTRLVRLCY